MEDLRGQPDFHDLLRIEDDALQLHKRATSPFRDAQVAPNSTGKITTPAKVLMVGEPVMVKTDQQEDSMTDTTTSVAETSGSSAEELGDGINSPSPETAAAMESLMADDDLTSASPKLDEVPKLPVPVSFVTSNSSKVTIKPQTSIMASIRTSQPNSIAGKKFTVATHPVQVVKKDGGGGPVVTKFIVKRTSTASVASPKPQVVFTKDNRGMLSSPVKAVNLQSGSIVLSPIKGGFKIPISPMKSPIKVSVMPPSNSKKSLNDKPYTIPINTSIPQLQLRTQPPVCSGNVTVVNGITAQGNKGFGSQQQHIFVQNRVINSGTSQPQTNSSQVLPQLNVVPNSGAMQDSSGVKFQYVQLVTPNNNTQQLQLKSNQGQPITFTSMAQLNGASLAVNQPGGSVTLIQNCPQKFQPQPHTLTTQRKAQTVKVAIPTQSTNQLKPQRLIMPATNLQPIRPNLASLAPGSVLPAGNVGYAMVPAKYVEQLTKQLNSQASFVPESLPSLQKAAPAKVGSNGKLKKPCNCTKSQCLKLYCECFANGQFCDECNCINCSNNLEHELERSKAIKQCLERNPAAFRPKIGRGKDDNRTHQKGCNCKRSGCLKNYCECYEARIPCTSKCKCIGCKNYEESNDRRSLMSLADAAEVRVQQQTAAKTKLSTQIGDIRPNLRTTSSGERLPYTFFTQEVIEATCTCLLAQAEEAEKTNRPMAIAEAMILDEFGRCVMQIIQSAGKAKVAHSH